MIKIPTKKSKHTRKASSVYCNSYSANKKFSSKSTWNINVSQTLKSRYDVPLKQNKLAYSV